MNTGVFLSMHTEQRARGQWGAISWISQNVYWIRITQSTVPLSLEIYTLLKKDNWFQRCLNRIRFSNIWLNLTALIELIVLFPSSQCHLVHYKEIWIELSVVNEYSKRAFILLINDETQKFRNMLNYSENNIRSGLTCHAERHPKPRSALWERHGVTHWSVGQGWQKTGTK